MRRTPGKLYMFNQVGVGQTAGSVSQWNADSNNIMWHAFGDPTLEIRTSFPFFLPNLFLYEILFDRLVFTYEQDGATITALQRGRPIGRAMVHDGKAELPFVVPPSDDAPIQFTATMPGAQSVLLNPTGPANLQTEDAFGPNAIRITFDPLEGREVGEPVTDQYARVGVTFLDGRSSMPTIIDGAIREGKTFSDGQSLANDAAFPSTSAGVPLGLVFKPPVQRVGMYVGNGTRGVVATLTAYDASGKPIVAVSRTGFGNDVLTFIGLDGGSAIIAGAELDYGPLARSEEVDDLLFE